MCHITGVKANTVEQRKHRDGEGTEGWLGEGECQRRTAVAERRRRKWGGSVPCDHFLGHRAWPPPSGSNHSILDNFLKHLNPFPASQHPKSKAPTYLTPLHLTLTSFRFLTFHLNRSLLCVFCKALFCKLQCINSTINRLDHNVLLNHRWNQRGYLLLTIVPEISSYLLGFLPSSDSSGYISGKTSRKTCKGKEEDTCFHMGK